MSNGIWIGIVIVLVIIWGAEVYDTANNKCQDSTTALHKLLHSFRIGHSEYDYGDLMSAQIVGCKRNLKISNEVIEYLKSIYG